jgi:hypothetical protein
MTDDLRRVAAEVEQEMCADGNEFLGKHQSAEDRWWARRALKWADRLRAALDKKPMPCPACVENDEGRERFDEYNSPLKLTLHAVGCPNKWRNTE